MSVQNIGLLEKDPKKLPANQEATPRAMDVPEQLARGEMTIASPRTSWARPSARTARHIFLSWRRAMLQKTTRSTPK